MRVGKLCFVIGVAVALSGCPSSKDAVRDAGVPDAGPAALAEAEPNDRPEAALAIHGSADVTANLGADPSKPDEDWYALDLPVAATADLSVSGIPAGDVVVEVYDADRNRLVSVNGAPEGQSERLPNLGLPAKRYVRVTGAKKGSGGAYSLAVRFFPVVAGFEVEPNDRAVDGNALPLGETIMGYVGHLGDEDWYRFELAGPAAPMVDDAGAVAPGEVDAGIAAPVEVDAGAQAPVEDAGALDADGGEAPVDAGGGAVVVPSPAAPVAPVVEEAPRTALRLELTPVENVAYEVRVLSAAEAPLFESRGKPGEGLSLRNIGVRANDVVVYVVVRSHWVGVGKERKRTANPNGSYRLTVSQEEAAANAELEPNDDPQKATPLPQDGHRDGFLSPKSDADYYALKSDGPTLSRLSLSGVERLDLELSVIRPGPDGKPEEVLLRVNDGALKEPEHLNNLFCADVCFVKVQGTSRKVDGKWVRDQENPEVPYRLTVRTTPDTGAEEREPNATVELASPVGFGAPVRGTIHPKKDVDYFRLDLSGRAVKTPIKATVLGILKVDVGLYLHRVDEEGKPSLVQTADRAKGEAPETIRYSAEPGVYLLEVRDTKGRESNFQDSYQLSVTEEE